MSILDVSQLSTAKKATKEASIAREIDIIKTHKLEEKHECTQKYEITFTMNSLNVKFLILEHFVLSSFGCCHYGNSNNMKFIFEFAFLRAEHSSSRLGPNSKCWIRSSFLVQNLSLLTIFRPYEQLYVFLLIIFLFSYLNLKCQWSDPFGSLLISTVLGNSHKLRITRIIFQFFVKLFKMLVFLYKLQVN